MKAQHGDESLGFHSWLVLHNTRRLCRSRTFQQKQKAWQKKTEGPAKKRQYARLGRSRRRTTNLVCLAVDGRHEALPGLADNVAPRVAAHARRSPVDRLPKV